MCLSTPSSRTSAKPTTFPRGEDTIVTGASFGGLASLWALALSDGEVGHAIAQSPSLWRFNVADALSAAEQWSSIHLQAGKYEGEMLRLSHQLAEDLSGDIREVRVRRAWRPRLGLVAGAYAHRTHQAA